MKVQPFQATRLVAPDPSRASQVASSTFGRLLAVKQTKQSENVLDRLFEELDNCGSHFAESKTMESFYRYKQAVKQVVEELSHQAYAVVEQTSSRTGSHQQIVRIVDTKLVEMYQKILTDEATHLEMLALIGELKGILVDRRG